MTKKSFSKIKIEEGRKDLLSFIKRSFLDFLQKDIDPDEREYVGLQKVFKNTFPIEDIHKKFSLDFVKYEIKEPKVEPRQAIERGITYSSPVWATLRLTRYDVQEEERKVIDVIEEDVYICDLPLMTERGSFIINGTEKIVVSQIHRAPGLYYVKKENEYHGLLVPENGSWIGMKVDAKNILYFIIGMKKNVESILFLKALGYTEEDIIGRLFSIEHTTPEIDRYLAKDVVIEDVVIARAGERINQAILDNLKSRDVRKVYLIKKDEPGIDIISNSIAKDKSHDREYAIRKLYTKIFSIPPHSVERAMQVIENMFFDFKRFNLGKLGRYRLNKRFGKSIKNLDDTTLHKDDIFNMIKYLLAFADRRFLPDDIDHLANRQIKRIGNLLEDQFRITFASLAQFVKERGSFLGEQNIRPHDLINSRMVTEGVLRLFTVGQLVQFLDQVNPLAALTNKRRISALGPGGLTRKTASFEVRDVHYSHYGRICPIETPEGQNIGLVMSPTIFADIDEFGLLTTPYRKVKDGKVTSTIHYLNAEEEEEFIVGQFDVPVDEEGKIRTDRVLARYKGDVKFVKPEELDYIDFMPQQLIAPSTALIPFLEHNDGDRALMGSNMQRQSVPLIETERPLVGTGLEAKIARDSRAIVVAENDGKVEYVDAKRIILRTRDGYEEYTLRIFEKSNQYTAIHQKPLVKIGDRVKKGDVIADGPSTKDGEIALGKNVLIAYMPFEGYNYEDAIIINEDLVKDDKFTSIQILEYELEVRETKLGPEEITRDLPGVSEGDVRDLDEYGVIRIGAYVRPDDILVGRITPMGDTELSPEERLIRVIFGDKATNVKDTSLRVESGVYGIVIGKKILTKRTDDGLTFYVLEQRKKEIDRKYRWLREIMLLGRNERLKKLLIGHTCRKTLLEKKNVLIKKGERFKEEHIADKKILKLLEKEEGVVSSRIEPKIKEIFLRYHQQIKDLTKRKKSEEEILKYGDDLPQGVLKKIKIYIAQKRKLTVGDKMAGRHGNKGVVSIVVPREDMPFLDDGTPVDIILNTLGVPSRMNIGQILEANLGYAAKILGYEAITPAFAGATVDEIKKELKKAGIPVSGKMKLRDGATGEYFDNEVVVGYGYMMKLIHMVDDKIHARSTGKYSLITQQPLGGKSQMGGQRFGEMEVWALQGYGAAYTLQEMFTLKSDDIEGRNELYESLIKGTVPPKPKLPASFYVLIKELQGMALDIVPGKIEDEEKEKKG